MRCSTTVSKKQESEPLIYDYKGRSNKKKLIYFYMNRFGSKTSFNCFIFFAKILKVESFEFIGNIDNKRCENI